MIKQCFTPLNIDWTLTDDVDVYEVDDDYDRKEWAFLKWNIKGSTGEYVIIRHWLTGETFSEETSILQLEVQKPSGNLIGWITSSIFLPSFQSHNRQKFSPTLSCCWLLIYLLSPSQNVSTSWDILGFEKQERCFDIILKSTCLLLLT